MEPLIELIRQIDGADIPRLFEICDKIQDIAYQHESRKYIHIGKLCIYISTSGIYDVNNNQIINSAYLTVVYGNKILDLICKKHIHYINWYSTTDTEIIDAIVEEITDDCNFYIGENVEDLDEHKDVNTSWLFATTPIKSAR